MAVDSKQVIVVMPAYNAAKTLADTVGLIPHEVVDHIILVDDGSRDATVAVARELGLDVIPHHHNAGYGANQKTCYTIALQMGADIVVMLHPDGQYDPKLIPDIVRPIADDSADVVLASRMMTPGGAKLGGMPWWKRGANRALTAVENLALSQQLSEAHTGYRAFSRHALEVLPWRRNANDFVFDSQMIFQAFAFGLRVEEIPVSTVYEADSSSASFGQSAVYGAKTLGVAARYALHRSRLRRSRLFES
ncbi:MAG TPA: glycosyltransferase family 2 protein [Mycobacteriales bacterium]|jgi:glycosyltransferase involved in cell wall biosynthesis|nr:glycosyltransferase family 2 protein [Mycobacteriales bacterium]